MSVTPEKAGPVEMLAPQVRAALVAPVL